jgi:hypothetical protein
MVAPDIAAVNAHLPWPGSGVPFVLHGPHRNAESVGTFCALRFGYLSRTAGRTRVKHTHFSVIAASQAFLSVVIIGTLWRLAALHLMASNNPVANQLGEGMSFQY